MTCQASGPKAAQCLWLVNLSELWEMMDANWQGRFPAWHTSAISYYFENYVRPRGVVYAAGDRSFHALCFPSDHDWLGPNTTFQEPCNNIRTVRSNSCESQLPLGVLWVYKKQIQKTGQAFSFSPFGSGMYSHLWGIADFDISCFPSCSYLEKPCKIWTLPSKASQ